MNLANRISIARILLIPFFVGSIVYYQSEQGLLAYLPVAIFFVAVISDALDGFIARKFNQQTELGTILDPVADKLLILSAIVCLSFTKTAPHGLRLPPWLPIVVISRDVIIVIGTGIIHLIKSTVKIMPSALGKITTFFQMSTILVVLLKFQYSYVVWNIAGLFTVISGLDYIARGSKLLNGHE